jgi:hypothetical protein
VTFTNTGTAPIDVWLYTWSKFRLLPGQSITTPWPKDSKDQYVVMPHWAIRGSIVWWFGQNPPMAHGGDSDLVGEGFFNLDEVPTPPIPVEQG